MMLKAARTAVAFTMVSHLGQTVAPIVRSAGRVDRRLHATVIQHVDHIMMVILITIERIAVPTVHQMVVERAVSPFPANELVESLGDHSRVGSWHW